MPAVLSGNWAEIRSEHARAQVLVTDIQDRAEHLVSGFETRIAAARGDVAAVESRTHHGIVACSSALLSSLRR